MILDIDFVDFLIDKKTPGKMAHGEFVNFILEDKSEASQKKPTMSVCGVFVVISRTCA